MAAPIKGSKLADLHGHLCAVMLEALKGEILLVDGAPVMDALGQPLRSSPKAATLKEIREFLKDHGIDEELKEGNAIYNVAKAAQQYDDDLNDPLLIQTQPTSPMSN
jgi:hypothetical protein